MTTEEVDRLKKVGLDLPLSANVGRRFRLIGFNGSECFAGTIESVGIYYGRIYISSGSGWDIWHDIGDEAVSPWQMTRTSGHRIFAHLVLNPVSPPK